jgi:TolB protein
MCYKIIMRFALILTLTVAAGCAEPAFNRHPTKSEADCLGDIIQMTSGFDRAGEAYFSKDMHWIIFQAAPKGEKQYQMYVAPLQYELVEPNKLKHPIDIQPTSSSYLKISSAKTPVRISPVNSRNTCGYFSPDGNSLVFASTAGKENPDEPNSGYQREGHDYRWSYPEGMEIFRADGWQEAIAAATNATTSPTTTAPTLIDLAKHPITNNSAYDAECAFSPDGKWISFTSKRSGDLELYAMRSDGSDVVQLTHTPGYDGGPFFSPNGKRLIYRSDRKGDNLLQVYVADITFDSSGKVTGLAHEKQITNDGNVNWGPYWHPDGKHVIYATSMHGHTNYELYLMRTDGSRKTRVTFTDGADVLPVFSPDGRYLLWTSKRTGDGTTQIFLANFHLPPGS